MTADDLERRLWAIESGRDPALGFTCWYRNPDGPEAADAIARLRAENFELAAGACNVEGGLIGDDHGHFDCSLKARIEQLERELAEAVAAERERCARIATVYSDETYSRDVSLACRAIAAAIRNGERGE